MFAQPYQSQQTLLPAEICIEAVIQAGGNTRLAAERLFGPASPNALANLTASIAQDPLAIGRLNEQLRTLTMLQAFDSLNATKVGLDNMIAELKPAEYVKFYLALTTVVTQLTAAPPPSIANGSASANPALIAEQLLNQLPPQARRAFMTLVGGGSAVPSSDESGANAPEDYAALSGGPHSPSRHSDDEASA